MSLYQDMLEQSVAVPDFIKEAMRRAVVIDIQNIADYYFLGTDQEIWNLDHDFPNVAPPWPLYWMEYHPTRELNSEGRILPNPNAQMRIGVLFNAGPKTEEGWTVEATLIAQSERTTDAGAISVVRYKVSPDGRPAWENSAQMMAVMAGGRPAAEFASELGAAEQQEMREFLPRLVATSFHAPFLATTFAHCKNTTIKENSANRAARRRARREGRDLLTLHTLEIAPVKRILAHEGQSAVRGVKNALHVCRGHFKDYRERGLFGKAKGLFWWPMHIRGDFDRGTVGKDYRVEM